MGTYTLNLLWKYFWTKFFNGYVHFDRLTQLLKFFWKKFFGTYILTVWHFLDCISERSFGYVHFARLTLLRMYFWKKRWGTHILTVWQYSDSISDSSFGVRTFSPFDTSLIVFHKEVFGYVHLERLTKLWMYFWKKFLGTDILTVWHYSECISERSFWVSIFWPFDTTPTVFLKEVFGYVHFDRLTLLY